MSRWFERFIGRENELRLLRDAYEEARVGRPRVVAVVAESGYGKTRLVQEFYNWLSTVHDGVEGAGYWPDRLLRREDNLIVNPDSELCGGSNLPMPFLWWAIRLADPGARNEVLAGALWPAVEQLKPHLAAQAKAIVRARQLRQAAIEVGRGAADIAVDWLGNVLTFGLLGVGKTVVETGKALYDLKAERDQLGEEGEGPAAAGRSGRDDLAATILADLFRLCKQPPGGLSPVPIVMVVDDAQWLDRDATARTFVCDLLERARRENWPLLLILTCWEREWFESATRGEAPGGLTETSAGDLVVMLERADGFDPLVREAFPGLSLAQATALAGRADGNPRFFDELLLLLDRSPKLFVGRDRGAALTDAGLKVALALDLGDLVADRFHSAPGNVRRALGLASLQGVVFTHRLVRRLADELAIDDPRPAIDTAERPFAFVANGREGDCGVSEFRHRAYHDAARDDLANHLDEDEAERAMTQALTTVLEDLPGATDVELSLVVQRAGPGDALRAGREVLARAEARGDVATAGELGERLFPLLTSVNDVDSDTLNAVIDAVWAYRGPRRDVLPLLERGLAACGSDETRAAEAADFHSRIGIWCEAFEGNAAALPWLRAAEEQLRALAGATGTPAMRRELLHSMLLLGDSVHECEGPARAMPLRSEAEMLARSLLHELGTNAASRDLGWALQKLAEEVEQVEGPAAAHRYRVEDEALTRALVMDSDTADVRRDYQLALSSLANSHLALDGPHAARPWLVRNEALARELALEFRSWDARDCHARALSDLADVVEELQGPGAAEAMRAEVEMRRRELHGEADTPASAYRLSLALSSRADTLDALGGPVAAKPHRVEAEKLARMLAETPGLPEAHTSNHVELLSKLAGTVEALEGPRAARPLRIEAEALARRLELNTPYELNVLLASISALADTVTVLEGPRAALEWRVEAEALTRRLFDDFKTPMLRRNAGVALSFLGDAVLATEGPLFAELHHQEAVLLHRASSTELGTPTSRRELARALIGLADTVKRLRGPAAVSAWLLEAEQLMRAAAGEVDSPDRLGDVAVVIGKRAANVEALEGAAAAVPLWLEAETLCRAIVHRLDTPDTRNCLAHTLLNRAETLFEQEPSPGVARLSEAEALFRDRHDLLGTSASLLGCLTTARALLSARLLGPAPAKRAFALETFARSVATPLLSDVRTLADRFAGWAAAAGTRDAEAWVATVELLLAKALLAAGRAADATEACRRALPPLRADAAAEPGTGWRHLADALLATAACESAAARHRSAATLLREAERVVEPAAERGEVRALRLTAAVRWFLADALGELDHADQAVLVLRSGLRAAEAFARFGQADGAAILSAYRARLSGL